MQSNADVSATSSSLEESERKRSLLLTCLTSHVDRFDEESKKHKRMHRAMRYTVFTLTAASTLLAGIAATSTAAQPLLSLLIVFVSATAGVVTSIEGLRKPAELWIHERTTYYALRDLRYVVEYHTNARSGTDALDDYFARMQAILGAASDKWNREIVGHVGDATKERTAKGKEPTKSNVDDEGAPR